MDDVFSPPAPVSTGRRTTRILGVILCLLLGVGGLLATCYAEATQLLYLLVPADAASGEVAVQQALAAQQSWLLYAFGKFLSVCKLVFSAAMVLGCALVLARRPLGRLLLGPALVFGMIYEPFIGLYTLGYLVVKLDTLTALTRDTVFADPAIDPEIAAIASSAAAIAMVLFGVFLLVWAGVKAVLYALTFMALRDPSTESA